MRKKSWINNKAVYIILIIILIVGAMFGLVKIKHYIGYAMMNASGGYITEIIVDDERCTYAWGAFYGMAVMVYNYSGSLTGTPEACTEDAIKQKDLLFPCMNQEDNELYASIVHPDNISWDYVVGANISHLDAYLGYTGSERDSAAETFTYNLSIELGTRTVYGPGTYTKQYGVGGPQTSYNLVALEDPNGTIILVTKVARMGTIGYKEGQQANYQIMLPIPNGSTSPLYYFYIDPYEECPAGWGYGLIGEGLVYGYVTDNTTGLPIENVSIYISTKANYTGASGFYNFSAPYGYQYIAGIKDGYEPYIGLVNVSIGLSIKHNFSMVPEKPPLENGTIHGFVFDNTTLLPLANVTVSAWGVSFTTNASGEYNLTILEGTHNLVATKTGYNNYHAEINITKNNVTEHNFTMGEITLPENLTQLDYGIITGIVLDNETGFPISNATISVAGVYAYSDINGSYNMSVLEGTHNLVAIKEGYENYINNLTVRAGNITYHNISMTEIEVVQQGTGTGAGTGAGEGLGSGEGAGTGMQVQRIKQIEQPKEIVDHDISVKHILKKIRKGTYIKVPVTVTNYRGELVGISFSIDGEVKPMIKLDKQETLIETGKSAEVELTIFGYEVGVFSGNLIISGDIEEEIPINILVYDKEKLPVEALVIRTTPIKRKVKTGEDFKYRVDLQNMLTEEKYIVALSYFLNSVKNNESIFIEKEDIVIQTSFSMLKSFLVPKDIDPGEYTLDIKAEYLGFTTIHKTPFLVVLPFYKYALFGILPLWLLFLILIIVSGATFSVIAYKKKEAEKRRYKAKVDFGQLPQRGPRSAFVGNIAETNSRTYFDLDQFQVHTLVAGASGSGKTVIAQDLVEEALSKNVAVIVFDPTAQWTGFLRKCQNARMLSLYRKYGMRKKDALAFNGNVYQVTNPREIINVKKFMKPGEINIFVTNKLDTKGNETFVANTIREIFHAHLPESKELIFLMVYDGIHTLLPKFGGSGKVFVQVERATREFRKWGVGLILLSQVIGDFPPQVLANINTQIQTRTRDERDLGIIKEEYGEESLKSLVKSAVGTGMVENAAYNGGKPYFVSFRPPKHSIERLSDTILEGYNKYNAIIDDLDYQIEQLEQEKIDVFDIKLELKLALDKVKSGNFNMVQIYLDGLIPRIKAQWSKLGKKPKKREVKLVSEEELKEEMEKAKEEREKQKEEKKQKPKKPEESKEEKAEKETEKDNEEEKVNNLIKEAYNEISNGHKEKASSLYSEIKKVYGSLPKTLKVKIFNKCVDIQKRIAG